MSVLLAKTTTGLAQRNNVLPSSKHPFRLCERGSSYVSSNAYSCRVRFRFCSFRAIGRATSVRGLTMLTSHPVVAFFTTAGSRFNTGSKWLVTQQQVAHHGTLQSIPTADSEHCDHREPSSPTWPCLVAQSLHPCDRASLWSCVSRSKSLTWPPLLLLWLGTRTRKGVSRLRWLWPTLQPLDNGRTSWIEPDRPSFARWPSTGTLHVF